nr:hypothetical protein [Tanacetum cinerariifolium]
MSTQQDIYAAGSESYPHMLNKETYVPWSSRLLRYAKSRPNGKLIHNSIINGPYVRRMIPEPCDTNWEVHVNETFHIQIDDELTEKELKQIEADDQAIQTILLGLPEDIYAAVDTGSENRPSMLNKENYVPWSSRLLRYAKSTPNGKLIHNSIINGPYVRRMISELGDTNREVPVNETFHVQTYDELTKKELKQIEADDQAIQTILLSLPEDIYAAVDSCETAQEIWLRLQQMMKGSDIGIQEKNVKFFNEWERFTSNDGESIESYYHRNVNQNPNGNGNLIAARAERNAPGNNGNQISQEKYDKLERCYQKSVYQEQCLSNKINNLHLSFGKQIMTLNEEISDLNKQLSKKKSTVSFLLEEKKKLKSDFKIREVKLLDKQIQLEKKIKELDNILVKTGQSIQTIHMLSPKPDSFYHTEQKMALGYQNPFYLKQAQKKQQSLYDGKVLLEKHDPPVVYDSEETLQLAQEITSNSVPTPQESKVVKNDKVIALGMFRINPFKTSGEEKHMPSTPEWSRHVTIVHQTKDLHTADYTQLYDFLKYNQKEVDELKVKRLVKTQDPLALLENSNNPYSFPAPHQDQPSFNQNYMQQPMPNPKDITDTITAMNMALVLIAKAFKLNYSTPTNNNQRPSSNPRNRQIAQPGMNMGQDRQMQMVRGNGKNQFRQYARQNVENLNGYNAVQNVENQVAQNPRVQNVGNQNGLIGVPGNANLNGNGNLVASRAEGNAARHNRNQIRCYNCRGVGHFARNFTVRPRRRDVAYFQTQLLIAQKEEAGIQLQAEEFDLMAAEVNANYILMANQQQASTLDTQTNKAPVYDSDGSAENDNDVIFKVTSVEQNGKTVEQHPTNFEETRALYDSLYQNLAIEVEKVNSVNRKLKETSADLTTELTRFKNQENCFEISQEKYEKLKRCYQQSIYQEQCLSKKINSLHLSSGKQIMTLNEEISDLNKQLLKEKSTVSFLFEEKKKLKSDFKIHKDELLDKQIQLEKKIKELNNILVKTGQSIQTIHMLSPNPDLFYHTEQKMALGYQNPFYLKQAQKKQQSLYDNKVLLEKYDPLVVHDSEETLQLAQESREKMKKLNKEMKPANYTKINHLSRVFVSQTAKSREELYFLNDSKTANVSKSISIPNEEFSDDTTPSVARKFLNEVKSTIVTLQAKFVGDFKSLTKKADESLAKHKALELEIERLLRAVVSQDIMSVVQKTSVVDTSNLQTELERTKERFETCIIKKENKYAKLWNDWYKKCDECKYDKISYDKAYKEMQQKIERLQAQLGDLKGKSKDTSCESTTFNPLSQKLKSENVELEFQVLNYAKENAHLKATYKKLFDSISVSRTKTKTIITSLQKKLHSSIYENAKLRAQLFNKVSDQKDNKSGTSTNTKFAKQSIVENLPKVGETHALSKPVTSNSVPTP